MEEEAGLSRLDFYADFTPFVKNTRGEKVGKLSKGVVKYYVNKNELHNCIFLWKDLVEKSVDNVEKFRVSTENPGIPKDSWPDFCG